MFSVTAEMNGQVATRLRHIREVPFPMLRWFVISFTAHPNRLLGAMKIETCVQEIPGSN
jgi:hypothetical protein